MVFYDGLPVLIDVGSGTYTRRTFSGERYSIWFNRSDYHNLPTVNGQTQTAGRAYQATKVAYETNRKSSSMTLDISESYPESAGLVSWQRDLALNRGKRVTIKDTYKLSEAGEIIQHLMTVYPVEVVKPGLISIGFTGR